MLARTRAVTTAFDRGLQPEGAIRRGGAAHPNAVILVARPRLRMSTATAFSLHRTRRQEPRVPPPDSAGESEGFEQRALLTRGSGSECGRRPPLQPGPARASPPRLAVSLAA